MIMTEYPSARVWRELGWSNPFVLNLTKGLEHSWEYINCPRPDFEPASDWARGEWHWLTAAVDGATR